MLVLRDLASGQVRALTQNWDRSVDSIEWTKDSKSLIVTAGDTLEEPIFRIDARTGALTRLTTDGHSGNAHALPNGDVLYTSNSIDAPDDLFRVTPKGKVSRLTNVNRDLLAQLDPVKLEKFNFTGANKDKVWGIKVKPAGPQYGAVAKLPIAFVVHGGPQGSLGNSWSYRWNPRVFASGGYAVVSVDFHGSTGYGQAFTDAIRNNWGGWPLEDLQKGLAYATANDAQLDSDRACALGASYGLHDELDRGAMARPVQVHRPARRRLRCPRHGLRNRRTVVRRVGARRPFLLRGAAGVRAVEPGQLRQQLAHPAARDH